MKKRLYHIGLLSLCYACADPVFPPTTDASLLVWQDQSSFLFAGLPVQFGVDTKRSSVLIDEWMFGDGDTTSAINPFHTFDFPGTYNTSLLINNGQISLDTTITISPRMRLFGSRTSTENGKFIFQNSNGSYTLIHTLQKNTSAYDWILLPMSETFDTLGSHKVPVDLYDEVFYAIQNKKGNIVILTERKMIEMARGGSVLKTIYPTTGRTPFRIMETPNGYLAVSWAFNGLLNVATLNPDFEKLSDVTLDITRPGFVVGNIDLEPGDAIGIHYTRNAENPSQTFVKIDLGGNILLEKNYDIAIATKSFPISSGYMLYGGTSDHTLFTKVDKDGNVLWTVTSSSNSSETGLSFFEDGSSILIFFGYQMGMKVSDTGQVLWAKKFGLTYDTFNGAVRNSKGNIVLLGTHQFDYVNFQSTNEYSKRDLVLLEIDMDGNLVP